MRWDEWRGNAAGKPTFWIKHLFNRPWLNIRLHKMVAADAPECFHTHPAHAIRIILWGGYVEQNMVGCFTRKTRGWVPGMIGHVRPSHCHRIAWLLCDGVPSYSLWIRFRKCAEIELCGTGWKNMEGGQ
jgi:hypothetical protein